MKVFLIFLVVSFTLGIILQEKTGQSGVGVAIGEQRPQLPVIYFSTDSFNW
ncbi:MAG: hypothetical protein R3E79_11705 [Caldilineaceae bacterium]